jgi:Zn-dependent protease with chaperone function
LLHNPIKMKQRPPSLDVCKELRTTLFKSLLVPVLVLAFFIAAPHWLNCNLRGEIGKAVGEDARVPYAERQAREERIAQLDFQQVCLACPPGLEQMHDRLVAAGVAGNFQRLRWGMMLSIVLVSCLALAVVVLQVLNRFAQRSRTDLIQSYRLGWKISMTAALAKVFLLIPLLAYGSFEFTVLLSGRYFPKLLIVIVIGGLYALWRSCSILLKKVPMEFSEPMCREVTPAEAPALWESVRNAAARLQTEPPDRILIGLQLNFYVTELAVIHDSGRIEGRTLYLSLPLLKQLAEDEVVAIIGHELGHFIGEDTKLTRDFYPLHHKANATMVAMAGAGWVGWPSFQLLNFFGLSFSGPEQAASRSRELLADEKAAELTSPKIAAHALVRFQVACEAFERVFSQAVKAGDQNPLNVPLQPVIQSQLAPETAFWTRLFEQKLPHPLDSHPPLQVRLEALKQVITAEQAQAIALTPATSAYDQWFGGATGLFDDLTRKASDIVEKQRIQNSVMEADSQTEEGRRLLEQHFPELRWKAKPSAIWGLMGLFVVLSLLCVAALIFIDDLTARIVFGGILALLMAGSVLALRLHRKRELVLNAAHICYSGWRRPLCLQDVQNITGQRQYSKITLTFHLKAKQPPLRKRALIPLEAKTATLSLDGLAEKPDRIAELIFKYFARQTGE